MKEHYLNSTYYQYPNFKKMPSLPTLFTERLYLAIFSSLTIGKAVVLLTKFYQKESHKNHTYAPEHMQKVSMIPDVLGHATIVQHLLNQQRSRQGIRLFFV